MIFWDLFDSMGVGKLGGGGVFECWTFCWK